MRTKTELNGMVKPIVFLSLCQLAVWLVIAHWAIDAAVTIARIIWG